MRSIFCTILLMIASFTTIAQEIVVNGGAEQPLWVGWTQATPPDIWAPANQRPPHSGSYHFYPQNTASNISELYQDINVSANASFIDAGTASYAFSGWRRGFRNTSPFSNDMDRAQMILEYRDAVGTVLSSFSTTSDVFNVWTQSTDTRFAPVGTRIIRIRLISVRVSGSDNDGYYDDISIIQTNPGCTPPTSVQLTPNITTSYCLGGNLLITGVATPANSNYYYTWYHNGTAITTPSKTYTSISKATTSASDAGIYTLRVEDGNAGTPTCYKEFSVTITLDQPVTAGTISSNSETCANTIPAPFTGTASTGGTAAKYYKWQYSINPGSNPWVDVQAFNTTATGYSPTTPVLILGYYRRIDSSGTCANAATNTITIRTRAKHPLSPISSLIRDTLCIGDNFQLIAGISGPPLYSMNGGFYYTWKKVQGTTSTVVMPTSNPISTYPSISRPAALADSGTYYLIVQDGLTATSLCKDSVKIVIRINQPPTQKALIQNHQEICLGTSATQLTELSPATGGSAPPLYHQWYTTTDTTGTPVLSKIPAASGTTYNPGTPATTRYYVRTDSVKYCPAVKTNFLKIRVNNNPILDSIRPTVNDTLCENYGDLLQLKGYVDSITAGKQSVNGGFYFTWKKLQEPAATAVVVSAAGKYTDYPAVSRPVVEADSGTYYLIVQDGIHAKECLDSIAFKIVVIKTCVAITCTKPDFVSIKVAPASNSNLCEGGILHLQQDLITLPATPPVNGYTYSWERTNALGTTAVVTPSTVYQDLYINPVTLADSGRYRLIVRDGSNAIAACAEISQPIDVTIIPANYASISLNSGLTCESENLLLTPTITNGGTPSTYIWQQASSASGTWNTISIQSYSDYLITNPQMADSGTAYKIIVSPSILCSTPVEAIVILQVQESIQPVVSVSANPAGIVCDTLQSITYTAMPVSGQGTAPTYQWFDGRTNTSIAGATDMHYTPVGTPSSGDQTYVVMTSNLDCAMQAISTPYTLNLLPKPLPLIVLTSADTSVCIPNPVFLVTSNTAPTGSSFQWYKDGMPLPGATNKNYTVTSADYPGGIYNLEESNAACSSTSVNASRVTLIQPPVVSAGNDVTVQKNSIVTLQGSVSGSVNYSWIPASGLSDPYILNPDVVITNTITYTLRAQDPTGLCSGQNSVTIRVQSPLVIPNVITPNGDGSNDTWDIEHIEDFPDATFVIYNRWGNIVWKANGNGFRWDGTNYRNGELLADGTYFYIIDLKSNAYSEPLTGYIQLIK